MKIFQTIQRQYAILGISSSQQSSQKLPPNKRVLIGFLLFGCSGISHFGYIFHVANGFIQYVESIAATCGTVITFVCFAAIVYRKTKLLEAIVNIDKMIDTRIKYPKSKRMFLKVDGQIERLCEIVFTVLMKIAVQIIMLPPCIISFGVYFFTNSGNDSFQLPIPMWCPFDSANPIGFLIAVIFEYLMLVGEYFIAASALCLGIGAYWFAIAATKEAEHVLHSTEKKLHAKRNQSSELKISFAEFIDYHGTLKQVEQDFSDVLQPIFMSLFTWSLFAISSALLMIQMEIMQHGNDMALGLPAINGTLALAAVFVACELGQRMTDAFDKIDSTIKKFDWYLFPIEIQRMLPMIVAGTQQPVELECFGSIACNREVFKKVNHRAYTYFMVLRQLGN